MSSYTIAINPQFNSLEVTFLEKPSEAIRTALKSLKFRWNPKKSVWYGFADEQELTKALQGEAVAAKTAPKSSHSLPSLWERCKVDSIPEHDRRSSTKDVAAQTRQHMKECFPELKISCRIGSGGWSAHHEVNFEFVAGPYSKESTQFEAIEKYVRAWLWSFNYDNSDSQSDYFDRNFYESISSYSYAKTEPTEAQVEDMADFEAQLELFNKQEEERQQREFEEELKRREIAKKEYEEQEARNTALRAAIAEHIDVAEFQEDKQYIITASMICGHGKENCIDEVQEDGDRKEESALIKKEVRFTDSNLYEAFCNMFLYDFDFLKGCGGSGTLDKRAEAIDTIWSLNREQRDSIKWIVWDGVAVFLNDELKLVVNPEGYNYARYVNIIDSDIATELLQDAEAREEETDREPLHFPTPFSNSVEKLRTGAIYTMIYVDPWTLTASMKYIKLVDFGLEDYAQYKNSLRLEYVELGKRTAHRKYITPNNKALLYLSQLPQAPKNLLEKDINEHLKVLSYAGGCVGEFMSSLYKYYKELGFLPIVDTLQF